MLSNNRGHTCSRALSYDGDIVMIPSKSGNVLLHPEEGVSLVSKQVVGFVTLLAEFLGCQKARETQTKTGLRSQHVFLVNQYQDMTYLMPTPMTGTPLSLASLTILA